MFVLKNEPQPRGLSARECKESKMLALGLRKNRRRRRHRAAKQSNRIIKGRLIHKKDLPLPTEWEKQKKHELKIKRYEELKLKRQEQKQEQKNDKKRVKFTKRETPKKPNPLYQKFIENIRDKMHQFKVITGQKSICDYRDEKRREIMKKTGGKGLSIKLTTGGILRSIICKRKH